MKSLPKELAYLDDAVLGQLLFNHVPGFEWNLPFGESLRELGGDGAEDEILVVETFG